jgi:hypothetical protein
MDLTYVILPQVTTISAFLQGHDGDVAGIKQAKSKRGAQPIRSAPPAFPQGGRNARCGGGNRISGLTRKAL